MSERERFEAWALSRKCPPELLSMGGDYGGNGLIAGQWAAWQAARSGQAAARSSQGARSDERVQRLQAAIEGECDGLAVDEHHAKAILDYVLGAQPEAPTAAPLEPAAWADDRAIAGGIGNVVSAATKAYWERSHTIDRAMAARMVHPLYAHPPARSGADPTAAPLPENATEPMQKAMQRAVMLRKSMNDVWRAALAELPEPSVVVGAEVERLRQALRDITDPIAAWQRDLQEGYELDGGMCVHMAADPETYKRMAREALSEQSIAHPPARSGAGSEEGGQG